MRIQGRSSPQLARVPRQLHARKTRSGCGIRIVDAAVGRGQRRDAAGRAVGVLRIALGRRGRGGRRSARRPGPPPRAPRRRRRSANSARPSPCATAIGSARARPCREEASTGSSRSSTSARRASNCSLRLRTKRGQALGAGDELLEVRHHLAAVADAEREGVGAREERRERVARARVEAGSTSPSPRRAEHVAVREAAARREAPEPSRRRAPERMSVMCTSTASKPARWNAAAISTWPLTPCSRRIATRGRDAARDEAARRCRRRDRRSGAPSRPGSSARDAASVLLVGAGRVVAQRLHRVRRLRPEAAQTRARARRRSARRARRRIDAVVRDAGGRSRDGARRGRGARSVSVTRATSAGAHLTTAPSSSLKSARDAASPPAAPTTRTSRPMPPANAISSSVTNRPPSLRSW